MPLTPADVPSHIATEFRRPLDLVEKGATVPDLYTWNAQENANYPLFTYQDGDKVEFITYAAANRAMERAARYIVSGLDSREGSAQATANQPTMAIFASAGESAFPPDTYFSRCIRDVQ